MHTGAGGWPGTGGSVHEEPPYRDFYRSCRGEGGRVNDTGSRQGNHLMAPPRRKLKSLKFLQNLRPFERPPIHLYGHARERTGRVIGCGPDAVARIVSSDLVPVSEGFQVNP